MTYKTNTSKQNIYLNKDTWRYEAKNNTKPGCHDIILNKCNYDDNVIIKPVRNAVRDDIKSCQYAYLVSWHGSL